MHEGEREADVRVRRVRFVDGIVRQADWVGFAFPMASGQFRVSRFALEGAASAVEFMRKVMDQVIERVGRSTKDQTY